MHDLVSAITPSTWPNPFPQVQPLLPPPHPPIQAKPHGICMVELEQAPFEVSRAQFVENMMEYM